MVQSDDKRVEVDINARWRLRQPRSSRCGPTSSYRSNRIGWALVILIPALVLGPLFLGIFLHQELSWEKGEGTVSGRVKDGRHWYLLIDFTHRGGFSATAKVRENSDDYQTGQPIKFRYEPGSYKGTHGAQVGHDKPWTRFIAYAIPIGVIAVGLYRLVRAIRLPRTDSSATDPPAGERKRR
ncbi:hypothetical protein [Actinokineospora sp.]|uniref:hypothetical protein n=1 Tax=Actinokineospora sp. TaxID=1872133 RepID=UPI003D6B8D2F